MKPENVKIGDRYWAKIPRGGMPPRLDFPDWHEVVAVERQGHGVIIVRRADMPADQPTVRVFASGLFKRKPVRKLPQWAKGIIDGPPSWSVEVKAGKFVVAGGVVEAAYANTACDAFVAGSEPYQRLAVGTVVKIRVVPVGRDDPVYEYEGSVVAAFKASKEGV